MVFERMTQVMEEHEGELSARLYFPVPCSESQSKPRTRV